MSDPYVGEIKMFAGNFAPRGWALCDGQLLAVSQNDALFSLFGTIYGGDGRTTFGLPDMRGRIPVHAGNGPGLTNRVIGQRSGVERVTLAERELPSHNHGAVAHSSENANTTSPAGTVPAQPTHDFYVEDAPNVALHSHAVLAVGGSESHNNMMPTLCLNFIVALFGVYPSLS